MCLMPCFQQFIIVKMEKVLFDNNVIDILHFNFFMTEVCRKNVSIIKTMLGFLFKDFV